MTFILIVMMLFGLPVFVVILGAALLGLYASGVDFTAVPIEICRLSTSPVLIAIPLFTFAGYLLSEGNTTTRLVRFSKSLLGWLPGGLGVVALVTYSFFTAITGATGITIVALGGLLFPALISEGYNKDFALGMMTASGSLGLLFPPSLPIILYGFVSGVSIEKLFLAGVIPGILLVGSLCVYSMAKGMKWRKENMGIDLKDFYPALKTASWEILIPFLIILFIYTGFTTAAETASLMVVYVLIIKLFIYKELSIKKDIPSIIVDSMKMVGGIMIILGASLALTNFLVDAFIPIKVLELIEEIVHGKIEFLILLNLFLIVVGSIMDIFSAIIVVVPLITPLGERFGIDPLHLGIIFLTNLGIGYNTPPVGLNLFIASSRFNEPILRIYKAALPFLLLLLIILILITYCPPLSLFLPSVLD